MITQFKNWGIKSKIMAILFVSIFVIAIAVETIIVPLMQSYFMSERQNAMHQVVEVAYSILEEYAKKADQGLLPPGEARKTAISLIKSLRFSEYEYFWIHDLSYPFPTMIMHPTVPSLDGTVLNDPLFNRASAKRPLSSKTPDKLDNKNLFVAMNEVVEAAGAGFVSYNWPKPLVSGGVTAELYPKVSFVKKYEPWGWVVGSGMYVDDVKVAVTHVRLLIHTASVFFCIAALVIYYLMLRYVSKPVISLALLAKRIATGDYGDQLPVESNDEVGLLSASLNRMSNQVQQKTHDLEAANRELELELVERRRAEESLRESEEKFRTLVDNSFDVIFVLDAAGVFRFVSKSWETHFGYTPEMVTGQNFSQYVHPDDIPGCIAYLQQILESGRAATSTPYRVKHANNTWRQFIANGTLHRDSDGNPLYIGIGRDISDEKRLEEERLNLERQLLQTQKLESLGIMAGGIAHDFNNLLAIIIGNLELTGMQLDKASQPAIRIERAMQASRRAADLTQQMLAYTGKGVFALKPQDLSLLVQENSELFRSSIPKTVTLSMETAEPLPPVMADAGQLQQVIVNLITNAAEAIGGEPGNIAITTGVMDCDRTMLQNSRLEEKPQPGCYAYIQVTDSGCGMDSDSQQRIFEPFYTTKFTGRGLGMSAVMGIIKAHNGAILLYSEPGFGSTFKILLPVINLNSQSDCSTMAVQETAQTADSNSTGTVLIVDDEELVREVCRDYIEELGFKVLCAVDGRDAINVFERHMQEIAFVILDLTMPNMDGVTAFSELRRVKPGLRVIISSGHATETTAKLFTGEMPDGFIQKPFRIKQLLETIARINPEINQQS